MNKNVNKYKKGNDSTRKKNNSYKEYVVKDSCELLDFLLKTFSSQSRNSVKSLLSSKKVSVNGAPVTQYNFQLVPKDVVYISNNVIRRKTRSNLPIIYEDDEIIVINKPSGLLSVASDNEKNSTAYRMVAEYVQQKDKHNRIFIVHRIDEDTSGVLMFAKNSKIQEAFQEKWNDIVTKRGYYAIVEGHMEKPEDTIKSYLKKNAQNMMYSSKKSGDGQLAITHYKVLKESKDYSLLDVNIDTGRKNQIRVHLGERGHYIIGDDKYGNPSNPLKRLGLHAYCLEFKHPITNKKMRFLAKIPAEFEYLFKS